MSTDHDRTFYTDEIQRDPGICNNCFRRVFDQWKPTHWVYHHRDGTQINPLRQSSISIVSARRDWYDDEIDISPEGLSCKCGSFRTSTVQRDEDFPISTQRAIELGKRLADRIEEKSGSCDRDILLDSIRRNKTQTDMANKDDTIFNIATTESIRRANQSPS